MLCDVGEAGEGAACEAAVFVDAWAESTQASCLI